eukprot:scaffold256158_cov21-Tisochrysis_lutea.AAC.4
MQTAGDAADTRLEALPVCTTPPAHCSNTASDAADALLEALPGCTAPSERAARHIILAALDRGNLQLALSLYDNMCQARGRLAMFMSMGASATTAAAASSSPPSSFAAAGPASAAQQPLSRTVGGATLDEEEEDAPFSWCVQAPSYRCF